MLRFATIAILTMSVSTALARDYHVATTGNDTNDGSAAKPLRTISAAASAAQPGDVITVHAGVYRERVSPPRGGTSDEQRITYQAAPGEKVSIKGSEPIKGWTKFKNDTWKVVIPNTFFKDYNPYKDPIHGDWFNGKGREHHTGAVYQNGRWLVEAANLDRVLEPVRDTPLWASIGDGQTLLNVAWLKPGDPKSNAPRIPAASFAAQQGTQNAPCSEGGQCVGWIEQGDWLRYENVNFPEKTDKLELRCASATQGGIIEIRLDSPQGQVLGTAKVPHTGDWQQWKSFTAKLEPVTGTKTICLTFKSAPQAPRAKQPVQYATDLQLWFAKVDDANTTIYAQFPNTDPNTTEIEINVRPAVFYPEKTGINYLTVRNFKLMHAATQWAPPTAGQIGLIGTHWSKGWIIENNEVAYSNCVGISLGKYGDEFDNTSADTAEGYVKTIERATAVGWSKENIGHHIVRNNHVHHCEQAGIVGSLGPVFCTVTGNDIHDIHVRALFTGAEMAGIKFHAAIDTVISHNHIYRTTRGIWLDWMAQGTRVTANLLHDNGPSEDLFMEVDHGPYMVDNNVFLSPTSLLDVSEGGAFVHNLFAGRFAPHPEPNRETPFHPAHSTKVAGLVTTKGGDNRFYNNLFIGGTGLAPYDKAALPMHLAGNVFLAGATPCKAEQNPLVIKDFDPSLKLSVLENAKYEMTGWPKEDAAVPFEPVVLQIALDKSWTEKHPRQIVTTDLLGNAKIPDLPYEQPDGQPYKLDTDYFGKDRGPNPFPGPFANPKDGKQVLNLWPAPHK